MKMDYTVLRDEREKADGLSGAFSPALTLLRVCPEEDDCCREHANLAGFLQLEI